MKKSAAAFMGQILLVWLAAASFAAALIAQAPFAPSTGAQPSSGQQTTSSPAGESGGQKPPAPEGPGPEGRWVPGHHFSISQGCLKKWICDCSMVEPPRGARIERTPLESIAGICRPGARGSCTVCTAGEPEKKCACKTKTR